MLSWMRRVDAALKQCLVNQAYLMRGQAIIMAGLGKLTTLEISMSKEMDALVTEVANANAGVDSAITAIAGLRQQIIDAGVDPAKLAELTASLQASETKLATAIVTPPPG